MVHEHSGVVALQVWAGVTERRFPSVDDAGIVAVGVLPRTEELARLRRIAAEDVAEVSENRGHGRWRIGDDGTRIGAVGIAVVAGSPSGMFIERQRTGGRAARRGQRRGEALQRSLGRY